MSAKRITLVREAATAGIPGIEKFAMQAARRIVRLQERRRKLRRELRAVDDELKLARRQLRDATRVERADPALDGPLPVAATEKANGSR